MKSKIFLVVITLAAGSIILIGATNVKAQTVAPTTLVQRIAQRFNLNENDVQAVFTEHRGEMQANRKAKFEEKLSQLVSEGKITEAQKQAIIAKHEEMVQLRDDHRDELKNMNAEERKAFMQFQKDSLEDWAKENNIDLSNLHFLNGMGRPGLKGGLLN